ncbi:MAG: SAM-dependent methyltransferase [Burkholderiaceae bacterium]|nr:SAM-dependent methyltransferase [Burkholderiaceae bacterium]
MQPQHTGTLHLIPVGLSEAPIDSWLPIAAQQQAAGLSNYIAENAKTARAFLKLLTLERPIQEIDIQTLTAKTDDQTIRQWLAPLKNHQSIGLVSEAGCPAVADPGARVVALAHDMGATVKPWTGPSSIVLGLMASGLDGQRFTFHGYAPVKPDERAKQLKQWEQLSARLSQTQILIETPYRNAAMFDSLLQTLNPKTRLCVACDVTGPNEWLRTRTVASWKNSPQPDLVGKPTLFLFQA